MWLGSAVRPRFMSVIESPWKRMRALGVKAGIGSVAPAREAGRSNNRANAISGLTMAVFRAVGGLTAGGGEGEDFLFLVADNLELDRADRKFCRGRGQFLGASDGRAVDGLD